MSWVGVASGAPCAGERMLLEDSIRIRASDCASADSGRWTAIWSPSKSALNAWQTSGCTWIALPSTSTGSNARVPRRGHGGARVGRAGGAAGPPSGAPPAPRRAEVEQPLEAVVAVDHAAVEVVEVRGGEPAAVELHHRAQLGRDDRDRLEDHPLGPVLRLDERVDDLQPLDRTLLLLPLRRLD